jgi:DNA primase
MASIPDEKVQEVRDRVDIVDLVGRYVDLRRSGMNYKGLCPFHRERSPSFNVNPARKGYKCFGCGQGGDAIRFVMELEGKSFPEAVRKLAEMYGVHLPTPTGGRREAEDRTERDHAYALMRLTTDTYRQILHDSPHGEVGRRYVEARGLSPEIVDRFRLGYAPAPSEAGWDLLTQVLRKAGHDVPVLELAVQLGLVTKSERRGSFYDRFRGRLVFPVEQPGGEVVAFSARIVPPHDEAESDDPPPKYVNSPDTLLATKGKLLFGLTQARQAIQAKRTAILVEGNVDVVKLHQWGIEETVAPMGTALTEDQARLLVRICDQVVMCFDGDAAGRKAAWKALPILLAHDLDARMVLLPIGEDPDSLGQARLSTLLEHARPALVEMMERMKNRAGDAVDARAHALDRVIPLIAQVPRDSARGLYADRAAELFGVPVQRVTAALQAAMNRSRAGDPSPARGQPKENPREFRANDRSVPPSAAVSAAVTSSSPDLPGGQAELAMLLVDVPHLAALARREGALEHVRDPRLSPIVRALLEGADAGRNPTLDELLDLVEPAEQPRVHDLVFAGRYRTDDGAGPADPRGLLLDLIYRCREEALQHEVVEAERRRDAAKAVGDASGYTEFEQRRLALRREQQALRHGRAVLVPAATQSPD